MALGESLVSKVDASRVLGVTVQQVRRLADSGALARVARGLIDRDYSDINQDGYSTYSNAGDWQFRTGIAWVSIGRVNHPNITSGTWNGWAAFGTTSYSGAYATSGNVCLDVPWQSDPCVSSGIIGF